MPTLSNPKHERFAQELAAGKGQAAAYELAGFKPSRANACRLQQRESIGQRVAEILAERDSISHQATEKAIEAAAISKSWVIEKLVENVNRAMQAEPVIVGGKQTGEYTYNGAVANKALELLGKEMGMFIERSQNTNIIVDVTDQPLSENDWERQHTAV